MSSSNLNVKQYSGIPFEVFTVDGLYSDDEIDMFLNYVKEADESNRTFTSSPFKNGKMIYPEWSELMYSKIKDVLPETYTDANKVLWTYDGTPKYIMYAAVEKEQMFGIHTDTGCEYDTIKNKYSKYTVLTYLNDDFEGGLTTFYNRNFEKQFSIEPRRNRTLIFDIELFHCGKKVTDGTKYWIGTELVCNRGTSP